MEKVNNQCEVYKGNWLLSRHDSVLNSVQLRILFMSYCEHGSEWDYRNKSQFAHTLYFVMEGDGSVSHNGLQTPLVAGQAYLLPKNVPFHLKCQTRIAKYWCHFSLQHIDGQDLLQGIHTIQHLGDFSFLGQPSDYIQSAYFSSIGGEFVYRAKILQLLSKLENYWEQLSLDKRKVDPTYAFIKNYVYEHLSAQLRVNEIADRAGLTTQSLCRGFKKNFGVSLKQYILEHLFEQACALLMSSDIKIKDIALELGFDDEYHFYRSFKKVIGSSPVKYRKQYQTN